MSAMRQWRLPAVLVLVLVFSGGNAVGQAERGDRKWTVQGRTLDEWIKQLEGKELLPRVQAINALLTAGPEAKRAAPALIAQFGDSEAALLHPLAALALSRMGAEAVPELQKALSDRRAAVRGRAARTLGLIGSNARSSLPALVGLLGDADGSVRQSVAQALGRMGPGGRPALSALQRMLEDRDPEVRFEAVQALWRIGEKPVGLKVLANLLNEESEDLVTRSMMLAAEMGPGARELAPALRRLLAAKTPAIRLAAAEATFRVTGEAKESLALVEKMSTVGTVEERRAALSTLGTFARESSSVEILVRGVRNREVVLRRESASALVEARSPSTDVRQGLLEALGDRDPGVRWWAALALTGGEGDLRRHEEEILRNLRGLRRAADGDDSTEKTILDVQRPERAVEGLRRMLRSGSSRLRSEALRILAQGVFDAGPAREELLGMLSGEDKLQRRAASEALITLGMEVQPALQRILGNEEERLREGAARALGMRGLPARGALPALMRLLKDPAPAVRIQAAMAVWSVDQNAEVALAVLNQVLKELDYPDRWEAIEGMGRIAVEARPFIRGITEILVGALKERDARVRIHAAKWLWRRTRDGKVVVPLIREALADRDVQVRLVAVETLGELSVEDRALPLLVSALEDREVSVRLAAEEALARTAAETLPQLIDLLDSPSARARAGIARVLGQMGPRAKAARPRLEKLRTDTDAGVRSAVEVALRWIAS